MYTESCYIVVIQFRLTTYVTMQYTSHNVWCGNMHVFCFCRPTVGSLVCLVSSCLNQSAGISYQWLLGAIVCVAEGCSASLFCSLACIARAVKVFGVKHLHSIGFLEHATEAVLANAEALNSWRMRTVLHILLD